MSRLPSLTKMTSYGDAERVERRIQAREQRGQAGFLVVDRDDDRQLRFHRLSNAQSGTGVRCRQSGARGALRGPRPDALRAANGIGYVR